MYFGTQDICIHYLFPHCIISGIFAKVNRKNKYYMSNHAEKVEVWRYVIVKNISWK